MQSQRKLLGLSRWIWGSDGSWVFTVQYYTY